jgi:hypothetical protein
MTMKKATRKKKDELRKEYDIKTLGPSVKGKYYREYIEGTNLVLLDPDVADAFPNAKAVNDALRVLVSVAGRRVRPARRSSKRS